MRHTTESHRPVHTRIGMVNVPAAVADRIAELEAASQDDKEAIQVFSDTADDWFAKFEALEAIVEKLPKTADGVPVVPGMRIFTSDGHPVLALNVSAKGYASAFSDGSGEVSIRLCYSTRAAAEEALDATN